MGAAVGNTASHKAAPIPVVEFNYKDWIIEKKEPKALRVTNEGALRAVPEHGTRGRLCVEMSFTYPPLDNTDIVWVIQCVSGGTKCGQRRALESFYYGTCTGHCQTVLSERKKGRQRKRT